MSLLLMNDRQWMRQALVLAQQAREFEEVPVGALVVVDNQVVGTGFNQSISQCDPSAHAEIQALRDAANKIGNYRLVKATLYVTLEPCAMCAGAIVHSRIERLVFATREPKAGVAVSQQSFFEQTWLNHRVEVTEGVMAEESAQLLKNFFAERRALKRR